MIRIAFVVISTHQEPWNSIQKLGQEQTWVSKLTERERILFSYSDGSLGRSWIDRKDHRKIRFEDGAFRNHVLSEPRFIGPSHAEFQGVEGYGSLISTSLSAMKVLLESFDPDYIVRTNVSSFWNVPALRDYLRINGSADFYGGFPGLLGNRVSNPFGRRLYASGAGIVLARRTAEMLIKNHDALDKYLIDDLAIGKYFSRSKIRLTPMPRLDIPSQKSAQTSGSNLSEVFHFRCKSYYKGAHLMEREDIAIMRTLFTISM